MMKPIILIPARLASTRLPGKPLALIAGFPMIVHVYKRAVAAGVGDVVVACDSREIADVIEAAGGRAVLTDPNLPSGSDRIYQALSIIDPHAHYDTIINVQGDMPTLEPSIIVKAATLLDDPQVDIGTLAAVIKDENEKSDPAVVKVVISGQSSEFSGRAVAFFRLSPTPNPQPLTPLYHHIGIYAYRRAALEKFVALPASANEQREKLEQLRAMDAGMRIDVAVVDTVPLGVDTPEGLEKARAIFNNDER